LFLILGKIRYLFYKQTQEGISMNGQVNLLNESTLIQGVDYLSAIDPDLERIALHLGTPPLWARQPGFPTLVWIILEQQVSLASARAAFNKLQGAIERITPQDFLKLNDVELKQIGFSRQKAAYCRGLALAIQNNELDLEGVAHLEDADARAVLLNVKGIGPWTADIYLLMALRRPDIWPAGDLALAAAVQDLKGMAFRPTPEYLEDLAETWRPWRAVAARLLWQYYLDKRK
jgi:DNA-3-methyladenine glycosylase II